MAYSLLTLLLKNVHHCVGGKTFPLVIGVKIPSNLHSTYQLLGSSIMQLSSMVRDMSVEVRVAAFDALGKTEMVSVGVLLQTLSKKVLDIMKEDKCPGQGSRGQSEELASISAGALVHGLEDEYHEVIFLDSNLHLNVSLI